MVKSAFDENFKKLFLRIKNKSIKNIIKKKITKIIEEPETGKPMRYGRKGTREVYVPPFRLVYAYIKKENKILFLDLYHKDEQLE